MFTRSCFLIKFTPDFPARGDVAEEYELRKNLRVAGSEKTSLHPVLGCTRGPWKLLGGLEAPTGGRSSEHVTVTMPGTMYVSTFHEIAPQRSSGGDDDSLLLEVYSIGPECLRDPNGQEPA